MAMISRNEGQNFSELDERILDEHGMEDQLKAILQASVTRDPRLPRRIKDGFEGVERDLDRLRLDWTGMLRTLDHLRLAFGTTEQERDRLLDLLRRAAPEAEEASRALKSALEMAKDGDLSQDLAEPFARSVAALEALEGVVTSLTMNVFAQRAAWEQYARAVIQAERMRSEAGRGS
jgi:hypothetical protein